MSTELDILEVECRLAVTAQLLSLRAPLTSTLRGIIKEQHPPDTSHLWFEH